jgi:hypothetical protein
MKYAVGEIVLVVIGILIAFQVNSWNAQRLARIEQRQIFANLHSEFQENERMLDSALVNYTSSLNATIMINNLVGNSRAEVAKHNLDSLFYLSLPALEFFPSSQSIDNVVQSGRLGILKNEDIVSLIYKWNTLMEHLRDRENTTDDWTNDFVIPLLVKHISFKDMDSYGDLYWAKPSLLKRDYYPLFQNPEFESIMDNSIFLQEMNRQRMLEAQNLIQDILKATEQYVKD